MKRWLLWPLVALLGGCGLLNPILSPGASPTPVAVASPSISVSPSPSPSLITRRPSATPARTESATPSPSGSGSPVGQPSARAQTPTPTGLNLPLIGTNVPPPSSTPASTPTPAPTPSPTLPPLPRAIAPGALRYGVIGASDSVGVGASVPSRGWTQTLSALLPAASITVNLAVSGSTLTQALALQLPSVHDYDVVSVWLAVNDLNAGVAPDAYAANLGALLDGLINQGNGRIFVGNVPDLTRVPRYSTTDPAILRYGIGLYNSYIYEAVAARRTRVYLVDLNAGSSELLTSATVAADGFHPNDAGYALIAARFADAMRTAGVPLRTP